MQKFCIPSERKKGLTLLRRRKIDAHDSDIAWHRGRCRDTTDGRVSAHDNPRTVTPKPYDYSGTLKLDPGAAASFAASSAVISNG